MNLIEVSGFRKDDGFLDFCGVLETELKPESVRIIEGCPISKCLRKPEHLVEDMERQIPQELEDILLVGYSLGAALSFRLALRRKLRSVVKGVFLDGPLRSDIPVEPPIGKSFFDAFRLQYQWRAAFCRESEDLLIDVDRSKLLTIGTVEDEIVPPAAKSLEHLGVRHLALPPEFKGHDLRGRTQLLVAEIASSLRFSQ